MARGGAATEILTPGGGQQKVEFPFLTQAPSDGDWYVFASIEETGAPTNWHISRWKSSASTPTSGWGSEVVVLETDGSGEFDDAGCNNPNLILFDGDFSTGDFILFYGANDGSSNWTSHHASSTTGIEGTYTKDSGGPAIGPLAWDDTLSGDAFDTNQISVTSTSGLADGDIIFDSAQAEKLAYIETVNSGTLLTLGAQVYLASGTAVRSYYDDSFYNVSIQKLNGTWFAYGTTFKFDGNEEYAGIYIGDTSNDPRDCTWRPLRKADSELGLFLPIFPPDQDSNENPGFVSEGLVAVSVPSAGNAMPMAIHHYQMAGGL